MILFIHLRILDTWCYLDRHRFTGEESFLHFMVYLSIGETRLRMSTNYFGGDPLRFTYSIRLMTDHLYKTFYHKISGDSMRQLVAHTDSFRHAIWSKLEISNNENENGNRDDNVNNTMPSTPHIPLESFRIFGFVDDTGFRTNAPGRDTRRRLGYTEDIQRVLPVMDYKCRRSLFQMVYSVVFLLLP